MVAKNTGTRFLALLLCLVLALSALTPAVLAAPAAPESTDDGAVVPEWTDTLDLSGVDNVVEFEGGEWTLSEPEQVELEDSNSLYGPDDMVTVIVVLEDEPLLMSAMEVGLSGDMTTYMASNAGAARNQSLLESHDQVRSQIRSMLRTGDMQMFSNRVSTETGYDYTAVLNGFSIELPYGMIEEIEALANVKRVTTVEYYSVPEDQESYDLEMTNSAAMIGSDAVNDMSFAGADGSGAVVAILDTGLDTDHEAFSVMPGTVAYTQNDVQALIDSSKGLTSGITDASETYVNDKVPYAYDYADRDTDVNGDIDHGVHVAGTVAGNNGEDFFGVAPNAQLLIMKVFADGDGSASDDIIIAGLDDAVKLGADSINMSLGSAAGFATSSETEQEVYNNCWDAGINLLIAAGNDTNATYGSRYGNNLALADCVDSAIVGSPSTSYAAMSVASMQNSATLTDYFLLGDEDSDQKIAFSQMVHAETSESGNFYNDIRDWENDYVTYEYVVVPGIGVEENYEGLDVSGKLALIQRGETTFEEKLSIAVSHGATGAIIYNNVSGAIAPAYSNWYGPMIGIALEDGEKLLEAAGEDGVGTVTFGPASVYDFNDWWDMTDEELEALDPWTAVLPAYDAGQMSSFSSIGPAPDLSLKPEISAPGGNIISSVIGGGYAVMSGTSMATPHVAGVAALVRNYLRGLGVTDSDELRNRTECLMMSTAVPGKNENGAEYSPRQQGAGLVNVEQAVTAEGYLSVDGENGVQRPKAELGWNETGVYTFSFDVHNISEADMTYTLITSSLTEGVVTQDGVDFSDGVTQRLGEEDFTVTYSSNVVNGEVTVPANGTATVTVTLTLAASYKAELFSNFPNGNYVEGYVYLQPAEGVTLVLPYLGFCGDWTGGVVFEGNPESDYLLQPTEFATANALGAGYYLGENPYNEEEPYNYDRLAFSPTIDGVQQYLAINLSLRRNVTDFEMSVTNSDDEKLWSMGTNSLRKTYYYTGTGSYTTVLVTDGWTGRYLDEESGEYTGDFAPAGQYYYFNISGNVAQCEEGRTTVTCPFWLDAGGPTVDNIQCFVDEADGKFKLAFDVQDDHYVRLVEIIDSTGSYLLTYTTEGFADVEPQGSASKVILDLDGLCEFLADNGLNPGRIKLSVSDYAMNHTNVYVDLGPQFLSMSNMTIAVGDSQQAELRILPARLADTLTLTWSSGDETIATVSQTGLVTGVAKGETTISARADTGLTATAKVTVGDETLPPETPESPDPDARVDKPSGETLPTIWDTRVDASDTDRLGQTFKDEDSGFWYKITGADTVQLIQNPDAEDYSASYPDAPEKLVIPQTVTDGLNTFTVTTIGVKAFYLCNQITSVTLPDTIRVIGDSAFQLDWWDSGVTSINLPEGLEEVGASAFYQCSNVNFQLPKSLKYIGAQAFAYTGIQEVQFGSALKDIGSRAFSGCSSLRKAELPKAAQNTEGIYLDCSALASVDIADGVTMIPENAFYGCSALETVSMPASVREIGYSAFYGSGLTDLCLTGTNVTTIGDYAYASLDNCRDIVIPDSVTYVGSYAFYWCPYVRSITFGKNVAYVGEGVMSSFFFDEGVDAVIPEVGSATAGAAVRRSGYVGRMTKDGVPFEVYTGAPFTVDGITYMPISANEVMVTGYDENEVHGVVDIPETVTCEGDEIAYTVTAVGDRVFSSKYNITEVHLPNTINTVGERAFDQIHALEYINIPTGLTTLSGRQAFGYGGWDNEEWSGVWNPDTLVVPAGLETWDECAFSGNRYTSVVLSEGLKLVGSYGLSNNKELTSVQMAGTVEYLKDNAFYECTALTGIELPEGLKYIGTQAFMDVPLNSLSLPDSLQYIGSQAFEAYEYDYSTYPFGKTYVGVQDITLGGGITGMGWNALCPEVNVTTVLGSTRNLVVERNNLNNVPTVCWDGKTDIPAGDYSVIPEGVTVTVTEDVRLDGTLIVNGTLIIKAPAYVIGKGEVTGEGRIYNSHRIVEKKPFWADIEPSIPILPILLAGSGANELPFTDVKTTDWFYDDVVYAYENGLLTGVSNDRFAPESSMTRAMLWTVLARLDGVDTSGGATWYEKGREWAMRNGISDGTNPDGSITREQLVTMLWRYAGSPDADASVLNVYADRNEISDWAVTAMAWATENGILNGSNGKVLPAGSATRAQVAAILTRYCEKIRK